MPYSVAQAGSGVTPELIFLVLLGLLFLVLLRPSRRRKGQPKSRSARPVARRGKARQNRPKNWVLVDGSNVMHWQDNTPKLEPLVRVIGELQAKGFDPGVVFDANAGWKLFGRYLGERELGRLLDLPQDQVLVVPKGSPADPWLLTTAREFGARIVTNDRFRDWATDHPEVARPGFLVRGGLSGDTVWLEGMDAATAGATQ